MLHLRYAYTLCCQLATIGENGQHTNRPFIGLLYYAK